MMNSEGASFLSFQPSLCHSSYPFTVELTSGNKDQAFPPICLLYLGAKYWDRSRFFVSS